ncbi:hypothetical protein ACJQWK_10050 [Exserohilum turcicum]|uniref:Uncharacterized protein n=1 Tax=Exserohilum turcicum (strain 28A) TaxID=671987 RepID=R0I5K4_EXST2|nr:uncharacterized protein SETTUDRAFT_24373 [Exserohilum turcica Et28A]EOA80856.1 hypothetical protein SETTUDRAFT_24373 [Exserohilum turcica Et28A]
MHFYKLQPTVLLLAALCAEAAPVPSGDMGNTVATKTDPDPNFAYYNFKRDQEKKATENSADPDPNFAYYNFKRDQAKKAVDGTADPDPNFAYYNFKKRE